jgi:capsular exopolysaccharide synthesis family protein
VAEDCPAILNAVIESYKSFLDEKYKIVSRETLAQVTRVADSYTENLKKKEGEYKQLRVKYPELPWRPGEGATGRDQWLTQLQSRRMTLMVQQAETQRNLELFEEAVKEGRARSLLASQLSEKAGAGGLDRRLDQQLLDLMLKEKTLLADYGPEHPDVVAIRRRIEMTREFFDRGPEEREPSDGPGALDPVQWHMLSLRTELHQTTASLSAVNGLLALEEKKDREGGNYREEEARLKEEIGQLREPLQQISKSLDALRLVQDVGGYDADVIAPAGIGYRTGAGMAQFLMMGAALGLLGGVGLAYLAEMLDKTYHTPEEIRKWLRLPVIGHVPLVEPDKAALEKAAAEHPPVDPHLIAYLQPKSIQAESFRAVRTALYFSTQGELHKVIQVTSPSKGDGKSTVSANLAISIAQSGKRVVLVDADLRKPRVHKLFGVSARMGLSSVLNGEAEIKEVVLPSRVPGLFLLPSGPRPANPAELLTLPRFKEMLDAIREDFDFVLIDTPPLLAVSDPSVVAPRVDGVLLTIRISQYVRPNSERSKEILKSLGATILGVVVNGVDLTSGVYGAGNYGYGYTYGVNYYDSQYGDRNDASYYTEDTPETPAKSNDEVPDDGEVVENPAKAIPPAPARGFLSSVFRRWRGK